jgi:bifunctional non-homologous end joining protein LigD
MPARTKSRSESAKAVDRQLARYRSMRDFEITPEPQGNSQGRARPQISGPMPFVVQKHAATRLHYDFRLGWHGVLKSWAVTKGPSYFPGDKRLAVEVEDHPMEYGGFEGTIPKGQYGGGTVMVWDFGEWKPLGDVDRALEKGDLKFELNGKKLKGKWVLVRMRRNLDRDRSDKPNWLLIKERDEYVQPEDAPAITDEAPNSAITQRTIEQIGESKDHVWDSNRGLLETASGSGRTPAQDSRATSQRRRALERLLKSTPREEFPGFIPPQLAEPARNVPAGDDWIHELKLDGYRTQVHVQSRKDRRSIRKQETTLFTRTGLDWTARMPVLAAAAAKLDVESCILDGEVVALDNEGRSNFSDLQAAFAEGKHGDLIFFAFDLLHLDGHNLRNLPLFQRKEILSRLFSQIETGSSLRLSDHIEGRGCEVFAKACELGAEGIVSKLSSARYTSGRGNTWLKMKCGLQQEFVIGGFTPLKKGGRGVGALLLGYYEGDKLRYAGRCGTGFSEETHRALRSRLDALIQKNSDFAKRPADAPRESKWVKPDLVAQVLFSAWTRDNLIRQASFKGLREDKPPKEVKRELTAAQGECSDKPSHPQKRASLPEREDKFAKQALTGFRITHPNKVVDQESGATKQQLAEYYLAVAAHILPHISDRPLSVVRCPDGIGKPCFFQKHLGPGSPQGVNSISVANRKTGKKEDFLTVNSIEGLLGLVQLGVLEIHPWGSKNESLDSADRIIFDLDPDEAVPWAALASAAQELRNLLKQFKLTSFLKSTGGKGLHVVVPIQPEYEWPIIKQFSHAVVLKMERNKPSLYITKMSKASRVNKIYLDYLRNDRESTAIAPFSTRARPGVPVAVTLDWKELDSSALPRFYVPDFARWKQRLGRDPWKAMAQSNQRLTPEVLLALRVKLD